MHIIRHITSYIDRSGEAEPGCTSPTEVTCSDVAVQGGKLTRPSQEDLVHRVTVGGQRLLHYPAPVIDVAVLRGTTADVAGNIGFEREAVLGDSLNQVLRLSAAAFSRCSALCL